MKKIYILILLIFASKLVISQYNIITNNGQIITICNADFFDNNSGNYNPNLNNVITFKANTINSGLKFTFMEFDIHISDTLYVYDGTNTSASLIGKYNNSNALSGGQNIIQSSIYNNTNATGASLTFKLVTDGSNQGSGWYANLNCTPVCQKVIAKIDSLLTQPHPVGNNYINACLGQTVTLAGKGLFPENNIIYHQNNSTCTFNWNFGDGSTATGQTVNHTYSFLSGYEIKLKVTDSIGCESNYSLVSKLRFAPQPIANINPLNSMCTNETQLIKAGYNSNSNVVINPFSFLTSSKNSFDSLMFIPDGPYCPPGIYNTPQLVNNFPIGATIQSANEILSVCVDIEHSFAGDLGFKIICPNNQSVILDPNTHSGTNFLGLPAGGTNHHAFDNGCLPANNQAGTGWSYCWSEVYPNNNMTFDQLGSSSGWGTVMVAGNITIDSTNQLNHTNYIIPQNPLSGLIGCPLNGVWNIEIIDDWASDNGYISHWDIQLQHNSSLVNWAYNVNIDSVKITGPFSAFVSDTSRLITPTIGGNYNYQVHIKDDFGCAWDTTLALLVVQKPIVNLGSDKVICFGDSVILNAGNPGATYLWTTPLGNSTSQIFIINNSSWAFMDLQYYNVIVNFFDVSNTFSCTAFDTIAITTNESPQISFLTSPYPAQGCEPLNIEFSDATSPYNLSYLWDFGDGSTSTDQNPLHSYSAGVYDIRLKCTTQQGCSDSISIPNLVTAFSKPITDFVWNPFFAIPNVPVIFTNLSTSATTNNWDFGDGSSSTLQNPTHTYSQLGSYIVKLYTTNMHNCSDSITHSILVSNTSIYTNNSINIIIAMDNLNKMLYVNNIIINSLISIYDISGKLLFVKTAGETNKIDVSQFANGVYILKINSNNEIIVSKFVKE